MIMDRLNSTDFSTLIAKIKVLAPIVLVAIEKIFGDGG